MKNRKRIKREKREKRMEKDRVKWERRNRYGGLKGKNSTLYLNPSNI